MADNEAMEILKKYDPALYDYYMKSAWYFGPGARNWAKRLKEEHEHGKRRR